MSAEPITRKEFFVLVARAIAGSRVARFLFALTIVALSCGLAYLCWQGRDLLATMLAAIVIYTGLHLAWESLPFSQQTRFRWARQEELARRFPSYRWRNALWIGLCFLIGRLWEAYNHQHLDPWQFVLPAVFMVIGIVSNVIWHIRNRGLNA